MTADQRSPTPPHGWSQFLAKSLVCLTLLFAPWRGCGSAWSDTFCACANVFIVPVLSSGDSRLVFKQTDPESEPWKVKAYFGQRSTRQTAAYDVDTRLPYLSLATYIALAAATIWHRWALRRVVLFGLPALVALLGVNQLAFVELALCELGWRTLPDTARMLIQLPFTALNGLLGMTYAVPGLVWWSCIDRSMAKHRPTAALSKTE